MSIKVLDDSMINKIAAGEVVERPSSVIKELVENSIDAGSTEITVEIVDGGKTSMRVTDNGYGILRSEVKTAFLRHATSKIQSVEDLESIITLGFRGEALSSISSVSKLEIITKKSSDNDGYKLELDGGKIIKEKTVGALTGTTITVNNLFYNVPARLKFLKKNTTESNKITEIVTRFVLGNPNISFKYINNKNTLINTNGNGNLKNVIHNVYGKEVSKNLIEVNFKNNICKIKGFICKGSQYRSNRGYYNFFLNNRYIKSSLIEKSVEDAYKTFLPIGKFPIFVLNLEVDSKEVDVNVHPTKLEVRFSEDELIYESVFEAIEKALKSTNLVPTPILKKETKVFEAKEAEPMTIDFNDYEVKNKSLKEHEKEKNYNKSVLNDYNSDSTNSYKKKDVKEYNKTAINDYISSSINFNDYKEEKTTNINKDKQINNKENKK